MTLEQGHISSPGNHQLRNICWSMDSINELNLLNESNILNEVNKSFKWNELNKVKILNE